MLCESTDEIKKRRRGVRNANEFKRTKERDKIPRAAQMSKVLPDIHGKRKRVVLKV